VGQVDPPMKIYRQAAAASRMIGYAGPPSAKATRPTQVRPHRHVRQGLPGHGAADAVKWAAGELNKIYES